MKTINRKTRGRALFGIALLVAFTVGCASPRAALDLDLDTVNSSTRVQLEHGQIYTVKVKENITTGFRWQLVLDNTNMELVKDDYISPVTDSMIVGAGGERVYQLRAVRAGTCKASFTHGRPWEPVSNPNKIVNFKIK
ncbi:protease inhibitor I42 family protein [Sphingobacterium tabacisoli]|uniref:Protease inhibitor I42 family protein n=1 Tax=Sphingobacterium tabacisoli TaxID=2044855 RepID=A0ABW5L1Z2_9SPHI|nr:protease inhibitor I42 family protein [Sphingobacterium tabacisoli]